MVITVGKFVRENINKILTQQCSEFLLQDNVSFCLVSKNKRIAGNTLIFANKTKADIILEQEFKTLLGKAFINILSDEFVDDYSHGMLSEDFLKANVSDFSRKFYVCGPPPMMVAVKSQLANLGVGKNSIVVEF